VPGGRVMLRGVRVAAVLAALFSVGNCATPPGMPPDFLLPVQQIVLHTACELRFALRAIALDHPSFLKEQWAIAITLTPKIDTEAALRAGLTGKSTSSATRPFFNTWSVGNAPGAEYDLKGHTDGGASYTLTSTALLDKKNEYPLQCDTASTAYNTLTQYLGVRDWLERTAAAADGDLAKLTKLDKPTYNSEITITIDGSGTFTYNYPFGTDFGNLLGSYKLDESVAIAFTSQPAKTAQVKTLPTGAEYSSVSPSAGVVSATAQSRLDTLSLQQSIVNLQTAIQRR
jgi:hypothetical protein